MDQETTPTTEETEEVPEVEEVQETEEHESEGPETEEAPVAEEAEPSDNAAVEGDDAEAAEDEFKPEAITPPDIKAPDLRQFVDNDGNLDLARFQEAQNQWMNQAMQAATSTATRAAAMQTKYEKEWTKAESKYPELAKSKQLRSMVKAIHIDSANPGNSYLSPLKAADQLFGVRSQAKAEGAKAAKESRTVQQAAALATPSAPAAASQGSTMSQLKDKMRSAKTSAERKAASAEIISRLVESGKI
jgi:hypothetical protein